MSSRGAAVRLIWATRGRSWGFRFLRTGGCDDPLPIYEAAFAALGGGPEACARSEGRVAVRFPDPEGRTDRAGRVIPHEFVVFAPLADEVTSVGAARDRVWPLVADEYAGVWDAAAPPS